MRPAIDRAGGLLRRRDLLHTGAWASAALLAPPLLGACASRPPPPPPVPPQPIGRLLVLPSGWVRESESNTGFGRPPSGPVYVYSGGSTGRSGGPSGPSAAAVLGVAVIATLITKSVIDNRRRERAALAEALAQVAFDPLAHLDAGLTPALQARGLTLVRSSDAELATRVRDGGTGLSLPDQAEAALDVVVEQSGYYSSGRAGGFSPMLGLIATLRSPGGRELESFNYYADWRDGGRDRRWITTPREMIYASPQAIADDAATVRAALGRLLDRFIALMVDDVHRHAAGQLRVD